MFFEAINLLQKAHLNGKKLTKNYKFTSTKKMKN